MFKFGSVLGIIAIICMILVIYDVLVKRRRLSPLGKIVWILLAIFFSILTAIVYFLWGRRLRF